MSKRTSASLLPICLLVAAACGEIKTDTADGGPDVDGAPGSDAAPDVDAPPDLDAAPDVDAAPTIDAAPPIDAPITYSLDVRVDGSGTGSVAAGGGGITCPGTCSATYTSGTTVTLNATPSGGSTFAGWSGACSGTAAACTVSMTQARTVFATFNAPVAPNLMFVTSTTHTGNLGGLAGADAICQARAQAAGLAGTYRAWLSTTTVNANTRFGAASGWVRVDGKPFVATVADLGNGKLFAPPRIDELGNDVAEVGAQTGTTVGGVFSTNGGDCSGWTSAASALITTTGVTAGSSAMFQVYGTSSCSSAHRLYCFGIDRAATVAPTPVSGTRKAFMRVWTPGGGIASADSACQTDASAAGLSGTYRALLATNGASALSRFDLGGGAWHKVDNVGTLPTAQAWSTATYLDAPPNLTANGQTNYGNYLHWTGAASPTTAGTVASTCNNWTDTAMNAFAGIAGTSRVNAYFGSGSYQCNFTSATITCLQL